MAETEKKPVDDARRPGVLRNLQAFAQVGDMSQKGVAGRCTRIASDVVGIVRRSALAIVQLRPPKRGTANVYGKRISAPTSPGSATSMKS